MQPSIRPLLVKQIFIHKKLEEELALSQPNHLKVARLKVILLRIQHRLHLRIYNNLRLKPSIA